MIAQLFVFADRNPHRIIITHTVVIRRSFKETMIGQVSLQRQYRLHGRNGVSQAELKPIVIVICAEEQRAMRALVDVRKALRMQTNELGRATNPSPTVIFEKRDPRRT